MNKISNVGIAILVLLLVLLLVTCNRCEHDTNNSKETYLSQAPIHRSYTDTWKTSSIPSPSYGPTRRDSPFANPGYLQNIHKYECLEDCSTKKDDQEKLDCIDYCNETANVLY